MVFMLLPLVVALALPQQQPAEKPVDENSARVTVTGCVRGRSLIVVEAPEHEPVTTRIAPGRVFRMNGPKDVMNDLKKRDRSVVQITGLVRRSALDNSSQGVPIAAGGRVRVGGMPTNQDPSRVNRSQFVSNVDALDVESFRPSDGVCPSK